MNSGVKSGLPCIIWIKKVANVSFCWDNFLLLLKDTSESQTKKENEFSLQIKTKYIFRQYFSKSVSKSHRKRISERRTLSDGYASGVSY